MTDFYALPILKDSNRIRSSCLSPGKAAQTMNDYDPDTVDLNALFLQTLQYYMSFRVPMPVTQLKLFSACRGEPAYYVCPRCRLTMEREFMAYCDRCGQKLSWKDYKRAAVIRWP